jgi:hypothetical protein
MRNKLGQFVKGNTPANKKPWIKLICKNCSASFERPKWILNQNKGKADFCSLKCKSIYWKNNFSGNNNPHWVGGKMTYRGRDWKKLREKIIKNCGGYCSDCGKFVGKSISIHHIIPYRDCRINKLSNLIPLCQSCHMKRERSSFSL